MRSRFSAYAKQLPEYIMMTTHPDNHSVLKDKVAWAQQILGFCQGTDFQNLEILEFEDGDAVAYVTFTAQLMQGGNDASFTERSRFLKNKGQWLYRDGVISPT